MSRSLEHAKHNVSVSNFLSKKPAYGDWRVITAFYAALHFFEHYLFPMHWDDSTIASFDAYRSSLRTTEGTWASNIHRVRARIIEKHCPEVYSDYEWLRARSHTLRYTDFSVDPSESALAARRLEKIREYCGG